MKRYGVIDLGTNTFHLLIAEVDDSGRFRDLFRKRIFVKLAEEGIQTIGARPFQRGLDAMEEYRQTLNDFGVETFNAFGTAALRTASNGSDFIQQVKEVTGIAIQLIPGSREALLIHKGVAMAVPLSTAHSLIMDIGGGSVEFIITNEKEVFWSQSFPIGVAVLFKEHYHSDPISTQNKLAVNAFLDRQLAPLWRALEQNPCQNLIGASGTFDVLELFLAPKEAPALYSQIDVQRYLPFHQQMIDTSLKERYAMEKLPDSRAELLPIALLLINFILEKAQIQQIFVSAYAMKEGILQEMIENN